MFDREENGAASVVRLPPLHRTPKQSFSRLDYVQDLDNNPWILDNPALRQLSTATSRVRRTKSRLGKRSFRNKVLLPDISLRKTRHISSARSMRSNISTLSSATVKSTRSLDMFRYGESYRKPSASSSAMNERRKWRPGSNTDSLATECLTNIPLPPIGSKTRSDLSAGDLASTVDLNDFMDTESVCPNKSNTLDEEVIMKEYNDLDPDLKMPLGEDYTTHAKRTQFKYFEEEKNITQDNDKEAVSQRDIKPPECRIKLPETNIITSGNNIRPPRNNEFGHDRESDSNIKYQISPSINEMNENEKRINLNPKDSDSANEHFAADDFTKCTDQINTASIEDKRQNIHTDKAKEDKAKIIEETKDHQLNIESDESSEVRVSGMEVGDGEMGEEAKVEKEKGTLGCKELMRRIFAGDYSQLPPTPKTSVRVLFIASPTDFHEERDWFVSRCYTQLQAQCGALGLDFQLIDLELPGFDHVPSDVMDVIYKEQLALCQDLSAGPSVLAFVNGDDLPRPIPHSIRKSDYEVICEVAETQGLPAAYLLKACYNESKEKDEEGQEVYQLEQLKDRTVDVDQEFTSPIDAWASVALRLREVMRKALVSAVLKGKVCKEKAKTYLETDSAEQVKQTIAAMPTRTHCYIRRRKVQISEKGNDSPGKSNLEGRINGTEQFGPVYLDITRKVDFQFYQSEGHKSKGHVYEIHPLLDHNDEPAYISQQQRLYLTKLCEDIADDFKCGIASSKPSGCSNGCVCTHTQLHIDVLHHARLCASQSVYRDMDVLQWIQEYILDENHNNVPLVIYGEADKNKSKLSAAVSQNIGNWLQMDTVVITRFIGTSLDSCDIKWVLIGLIYQICHVYGMSMPQLDELLNFDRTVGCFNALLASVAMQYAVERPLVVILDSLENLKSIDGNHTTSWMPQISPPGVHLITTISSEAEDALSTLKFKLMETKNFYSLDMSGEKEEDTTEKSTSLTSGLDADVQKTSRGPSREDGVDEQSKDENENMIESSLIKENIPKIGRPLQRKKQVDAKKGLAALVSKRLKILEKRYGEIVMSWLLSYLVMCEGLSEVELADVLSCNPDVMEEVFIGSDVPKEKQWRFPEKLLSLIKRDIAKFLDRRYIDGKMLICIGDEQVKETIRKRYLHPERFADCCLQMADLMRHSEFSSSITGQDVDSEYSIFNRIAPQPLRCNNRRQLRMLPMWLYHSGPFPAIRDEMKSEIHCNFKWINTKLKAFDFNQVLDDYTLIKEKDNDINYLQGLLMLAKTALQKNPDHLGTEILARCSKHIRDSSIHLNNLWSDAHRWFDQNYKGLYLMPMYPCLAEPTGFLTRSIYGPWHILGNCKHNTLAVWGKETGLELWSPSNYQCVHHLCNPFTWEDTFLSQEMDTVYQTMDTRFLGWDIKTGKLVCDIDVLPHVSMTGRQQNLNTDDSFLSPMCISPDKVFAAVRINKPEMLLNNRGLALIDLQRAIVVHTAIESMGDRVSNCRFTRDNNKLVVTETQILPGQLSIIHVFDCLTMEEMGCHELNANLTIVPDTMYITSDDAYVVVGCRPDNILVYETKDCKPVCVPTDIPDEDERRFVDVKLLPNDMAMILSIDTTQASVLRVSGLDGQIQGPIMTSHSGRPKFVNVLPKYYLAFVGHLDNGAVDIWDYQEGGLLYIIKGHTGHITSTLISSDQTILYTGGIDGIIKVWDLQSMLMQKGYHFQSNTQKDDEEQKLKTIHRLRSLRSRRDLVKQRNDSGTLIQSPFDSDSRLNLDRIIHHDEYCQSNSILDASFGTSMYTTSEATLSIALSPSTETESTAMPASTMLDTDDESIDCLSSELQRTPVCETEEDNEERGASQLNVEDQSKSADRDTNCSVENDSGNKDGTNPNSIEQHIYKNLPQEGTINTYEEQLNHMTARGDTNKDLIENYTDTDHVSSLTTGRKPLSNNEELNSQLEEIFEKLDNPRHTEYPVLERKPETPILETIVLGSEGEELNHRPSDIVDVNKFLVTKEKQWLISSYKRGPPIVWNIDTADIISRLDMPWDTGTITEIMLDKDSRLFALARLGYADAKNYGCDNCVRIWDLWTGVCEAMPEEPLVGDTFKLTPDRKRLVLLKMRESGTRFTILDALSLEKLTVGEVNCHLKSPYFIVTSDIRWIITCEPGVKVSFWNINKEDEYGVSEHKDLPIASIPPAMALTEQEDRILIGTGYGNIFSLELSKIEEIEPTASDLRLVHDRHQGEVLCLKLSDDNCLLVTASADSTVGIIDIKARRVLHVLIGHKQMVTCIDISHCNSYVLSGSADNTVRLWCAKSGQNLNVFNAYHDVFAVNFCPMGKNIVFLMDQNSSRSMVMAKITGRREQKSSI